MQVSVPPIAGRLVEASGGQIAGEDIVLEKRRVSPGTLYAWQGYSFFCAALSPAASFFFRAFMADSILAFIKLAS